MIEAHGVALCAEPFAQLLALDFADRVLSLVLISTSPATPGERRLPPPSGEFGRLVATAEVDWSDTESVGSPATCQLRRRSGSLPSAPAARRVAIRSGG